VSAAGLLTALLALRLARGVGGAGDAAWVAAGLLAGWVAADFASGLVHWWADRIAREDFPLLGESFVRPFREHHLEPSSICDHGLLETNGNNCLVVLPFLGIAWLLVPPLPGGSAALLGTAGFLGLAAAGCLTNQIHKWAHLPRVPAALGWLQRAGLLLSPEHHARHHTPPFTSRYCITTGWLDPLLDRLGFFPALERMLQRR
jgi:hypothetical protein